MNAKVSRNSSPSVKKGLKIKILYRNCTQCIIHWVMSKTILWIVFIIKVFQSNQCHITKTILWNHKTNWNILCDLAVSSIKIQIISIHTFHRIVIQYVHLYSLPITQDNIILLITFIKNLPLYIFISPTPYPSPLTCKFTSPQHVFMTPSTTNLTPHSSNTV